MNVQHWLVCVYHEYFALNCNTFYHIANNWWCSIISYFRQHSLFYKCSFVFSSYFLLHFIIDYVQGWDHADICTYINLDCGNVLSPFGEHARFQLLVGISLFYGTCVGILLSSPWFGFQIDIIRRECARYIMDNAMCRPHSE